MKLKFKIQMNESPYCQHSESLGKGSIINAVTAINKTDWTYIYTQPDPVAYFAILTPLDYGFSHNRFCDMVSCHLEEILECKKNLITAFELGANYGNTTLAYKCGLDWTAVGSVWNDPTSSIVPTRNIRAVAVDLSEPALKYGLSKNIFNDIFHYDFNTRFTPMMESILEDSDMLVMMMTTSYLEYNSLKSIIEIFLRKRNKKKVMLYNWLCAFDNRNLTPDRLFFEYSNWYCHDSTFCKHRNFTEEEKILRFNCSEAWNYIYFIIFDIL